jgi:hypothetical protein
MSLEKSKAAGFWELSLIGQFRAIDRDKARLFAQAVANAAEELGLHDCGWDVREMSADVLTDEQARMKLLNDTWRPEWGDKPWEEQHRAQRAVEELSKPFSNDPTHEEVRRQIVASAEALKLPENLREVGRVQDEIIYEEGDDGD